LLNKFVKTVGLTLTNVLMGSIFGLIRGVLIAFLLILVAENFRFIDKETLSKSILVPMIKEYVEKTLPYLPEEWLTHVEYDNILT